MRKMVVKDGYYAARLIIRDCFAEPTDTLGKVKFDRIQTDSEQVRDALDQFAEKYNITIKILPFDATPAGGACWNLEHGAKHAAMVNEDHDSLLGTITYFLNFGDLTTTKTGTAHTVGLPELIFGLPDELNDLEGRRIDTGNGPFLGTAYLQTRGDNFILGEPKVCRPRSKNFNENLERFISATGVYHSQHHTRVGMLGSDCRDFFLLGMQNREPLVRQNVDLVSENLGRFVERAYSRQNDSEDVTEAMSILKGSANYSRVNEEKIVLMAKLLAEMKDWAKREQLDAAGVDCWTYMQQTAKVCACSGMAAMSQSGISFACENDVYGAMSMQAAAAAAERPAGLADIFNCIFSATDKEKYMAHPEIGPALKEISKQRDISVDYLIDNLGMPFHCGVWADDLTGDAKCDTQLIMEKFITAGDSIGCRAAYLKEGELVTTRIAPNASGGLTAYVYITRVIPKITGTKSFGGYGFTITPEQEKVMAAIHGDVTHTQRAPFPHHGAIVRGGNEVADRLVMGYKLCGYEVMDLRPGKGIIAPL